VTLVKWKLVSVHLEVVITSRQDRCMVCAKYALKSLWAHQMVLLRDVGQVEARFGPFRGTVNLGLR
jgi:hypothetical protein